MGYCIILKERNQKKIELDDFKKAFDELYVFYKLHSNIDGYFNEDDNSYRGAYCDYRLEDGEIIISGSFSISGEHAEGFTLSIVNSLQNMGYYIKVESEDFKLK